jgi:hypothetical protein
MTTDFVPDDATFTAVLAVDDDAVGASRDVIYEDRFGTLHRIETERGADGNSVLKTETVIFSGDSAIEREFVIDHTVTVDGASNQTGQTLTGFKQDGLGLDLGTLGNIVGSQIGAALGGNSVVGRIAAGTIVGTIAQNVGQFIQTAANASLTDSANGATIGNAADLAFRDFGLELVGNLKGQVIGQISSLLMAELAEALDIRDPFANGLFTSVGTTLTSQLLNNVSGMVLNAAGVPGYGAVTLFTGLDPLSIVNGIEGAVFGYLGNHLGGKVIVPDSQEGAIGSSIGGAIGAFVGSWFLGPIGAGIGSFVGNVLGTAVGQDAESWGAVWLDPASGRLVAGGEHNGGVWPYERSRTDPLRRRPNGSGRGAGRVWPRCHGRACVRRRVRRGLARGAEVRVRVAA